jgi:hypothetical protein
MTNLNALNYQRFDLPGQLLCSSSGVPTNFVGGTGVNITHGSGTISVDNYGALLTPIFLTTSTPFVLSPGTQVILAVHSGDLVLPPVGTSSIGQIIRIICFSADDGFSVRKNATTQNITIGTTMTSLNGSIACDGQSNQCITLQRATKAGVGELWVAYNVQGSFLVV